MSVALGNLAGLAIVGRAGNFLKDTVTKKPWANSGLTNVPFVKYIVDFFTDYTKLQKEVKKDNPDDDKIKEHASGMVKNVLSLNGVAVEGPEKIFKGYKKLIEGDTEYPVLNALGLGEPYSTDKDKNKELNE